MEDKISDDRFGYQRWTRGTELRRHDIMPANSIQLQAGQCRHAPMPIGLLMVPRQGRDTATPDGTSLETVYHFR